MKKYFVFALVSLTILSCKKTITQPKSGIFRGTYEVTGLNGGDFHTGGCTISLDEVQLKYNFVCDTTADIYFASNGIYSIIDASKMKFDQKTGKEQHINPNIYVDSVFNYKFDDTRFELTRTIDTILYEYSFIRY